MSVVESNSRQRQFLLLLPIHMGIIHIILLMGHRIRIIRLHDSTISSEPQRPLVPNPIANCISRRSHHGWWKQVRH